METKPPLISVVVPVYNTVEFIDKCLLSLTKQTIKDIEIIVVDDGSNDGSEIICDEWAKKDNRIHVIHQNNSGSACARQVGMDNSNGEFVIVCDSDDWVEPTTYEKAYNLAKKEKADMVFFGYYANYPDGTQKEWIRNYSDLTDIEKVRSEIMNQLAYTSWNKLIRRELFLTNNISYEPGINMGEDLLILHKILSVRPLKIVNLKEPLYHYRQRDGGYTHNIKSSSILQLIYCHNYVKSTLPYKQFSQEIKNNAINIMFEALRCQHFKKDVFKYLSNEINVSELCSSPRSPQKLIVLIGKLFGWKIGHLAYIYLLPKLTHK